MNGNDNISSKNTIIEYFSAQVNTARLAKTISGVLDCPVCCIEPVEKYTAADLNWNDKKSRSTLEMNDKNSRPAIKDCPDCIVQDNIILMFPIWWYEAPRIIQAFLESLDLSGKTIIPVFTSGGSGYGRTGDILKKSCSESTRWLAGKRFSPGASAQEIADWARGLGIDW